MSTQLIVFQNHSGREASGLRALFPPSRTSLLGYRVSSLPEGTSAVEAEVNSRAAELVWEPPIAPGTEVALSVDYLGEALTVRELAWRDAHGTLHPHGAALSQEMMMLLGAASIGELATHTREIDFVRGHIVAQIGNPGLRAIHEFFCEFDSETNPRLMSNVSKATAFERGPIIKTISEDLKRRVLRRAASAATNKTQPASDLPITKNTVNIEKISTIQLEIFDRHFVEPGKDFDIGRFWEAFAAFANGELKVDVKDPRWQEWDAAPRSAFAFSFAEFALMAVDSKVHSNRWIPLVWPLVAMQEVYIAAFQPRTGDPKNFKFSDYQPDNWQQGKTMMSGSDKLKVRQKYEQKKEDLDWLRIQAGMNANSAFPAGG